jgi:hypothetical protein
MIKSLLFTQARRQGKQLTISVTEGEFMEKLTIHFEKQQYEILYR